MGDDTVVGWKENCLQSLQILHAPITIVVATMRCCSPLIEEEGSQIIVVVVNPLVQHPCPMF
jgi:hypothetical protein